jgi:hypothetical protein
MVLCHNMVSHRQLHGRRATSNRPGTPCSPIPVHTRMIRRALHSSGAKSTKLKRAHGVKLFKAFAKRTAVPRSSWLPASEQVLAAFAASFAGKRAAGTVRGYLAAVRWWHTEKGVPWNGSDLLRNVMKGVDSMTPPSSVRQRKKPITIAMLKAINAGLDHACGRDACIRMVANVAFFSQLRLGEVLHPSRHYASFDRSRQPTLSDVSVAENGIDYCLALPSTKSEPIRGETVTIPSHSGSIDPTHAIRAHRALNKIHGATALVSFMENGHRVLLTRDDFMRRINEILSSYGWDTVSGHSFRIGGTSFYLMAGLHPDLVKTLGRWKSDAFLRYWRQTDKIAELHLAKLEGFRASGRPARSTGHVFA